MKKRRLERGALAKKPTYPFVVLSQKYVPFISVGSINKATQLPHTPYQGQYKSLYYTDTYQKAEPAKWNWINRKHQNKLSLYLSLGSINDNTTDCVTDESTDEFNDEMMSHDDDDDDLQSSDHSETEFEGKYKNSDELMTHQFITIMMTWRIYLKDAKSSFN